MSHARKYKELEEMQQRAFNAREKVLGAGHSEHADQY